MPSSPITGPVTAREGLLACLERVPDPRDPRGVRYPLAGLLAVAVSAVLAGARSFAAIGQWAGVLDPVALAGLGVAQAPTESNLRKVFARLDTAALDLALAVHTWTSTRHVGGRRVIAIDGKTVRGARTATTVAPHLVAALDHATGVVLGQVAVAAKSNEIPAARDLLAGFDPADLHGSVCTLDAMHTLTDTAQVILDAGADYVLTVKANQRRLRDRLKKLPWDQVPAHRVTQTVKGRRLTRTIKVIDAPAWTGFTGAAQVAQLRRTRTIKSRKSVEVVYLITAAPAQDAPPATLAGWVQRHWHIENRLHWVSSLGVGNLWRGVARSALAGGFATCLRGCGARRDSAGQPRLQPSATNLDAFAATIAQGTGRARHEACTSFLPAELVTCSNAQPAAQ